MTTEAFWDIIAAAKAESGGSWEGRLEALAGLLSKLPPAEIVEFERNFQEQRIRAYTWELWGAAYILGGWCIDDDFTDFRAWLISMGKDIFEQALRDPDSLADITFGPNPGEEEDAFFEEYACIANRVYHKMTGQELSGLPVDSPEDPTGIEWCDYELPERYPRLWAQNPQTPTEQEPGTIVDAATPESAEGKRWWEFWKS